MIRHLQSIAPSVWNVIVPCEEALAFTFGGGAPSLPKTGNEILLSVLNAQLRSWWIWTWHPVGEALNAVQSWLRPPAQCKHASCAACAIPSSGAGAVGHVLRLEGNGAVVMVIYGS